MANERVCVVYTSPFLLWAWFVHHDAFRSDVWAKVFLDRSARKIPAMFNKKGWIRPKRISFMEVNRRSHSRRDERADASGCSSYLDDLCCTGWSTPRGGLRDRPSANTTGTGPPTSCTVEPQGGQHDRSVIVNRGECTAEQVDVVRFPQTLTACQAVIRATAVCLRGQHQTHE